MIPEKTIQLKYGTGQVQLPLPQNTSIVGIREPEKKVSIELFAKDLALCLSLKNFSGRRASVVVADKTRLCDYDQFLPVLVDQLELIGVDPEKITFLIAYGTHPAQSGAESQRTYGNVFSRFRFVHHDCRDESLFQEMGRTSRGTAIRLRKDILETDFLITFGAISHHYFAGYGGGRKLIFPGLGHRDDIYQNHSLFLDKQSRTLSRGCRPGQLEGNPLAEDLAEIEAAKPVDLAIHGILNSHGQVCNLLIGENKADFLQACSLHGENCEVQTGEQYAMVVASCGGHPKDINFIQAHKALHNAADFVADGGTLILYARCPDGIGSKTFLPWFQFGSRESAFDRLLHAYEGNGGTALAMMEKTERIRICLVTDLPSDLCEIISVEKLDGSLVEKKVLSHKGILAIIPNASLLVRKPLTP